MSPVDIRMKEVTISDEGTREAQSMCCMKFDISTTREATSF